MCTTWSYISPVIGVVVACFGAHLIVAPIINRLWAIARRELPASPATTIRTPEWIAFWHGVIERGVYLLSVVLGKPEGIAVWLTFKAVIRWKVSDEKEDPSNIPASPIYLIGTALNVGFGILGAFIARGRWSL